MTIKFQSTFVRCEPSQIVEALVGLKDIRVLAYRRIGPDVELVIEQTVVDRLCPNCGTPGQIKELPDRALRRPARVRPADAPGMAQTPV